MKYDPAAERRLIDARGDNMIKTWTDKRIQNRVRGLELNLFAPDVGLLDMLEHHGVNAGEEVDQEPG